jgi:signal recognition particle receptor subunit alpha
LLLSSTDNQSRFDKTYQALLQKHRIVPGQASSSSSQNQKSSSNINKGGTGASGGGKEKRQWHDGKAKITKEAMAELDRSKAVTEDEIQKSEEDALAEARAAYLPTDADLADFGLDAEPEIVDEDESSSGSSTWGSSLQGMFQQMTGQKVLTKQDLEQPLLEIHKMLTSKNVAADIATKMCDRVRSNLVGQKLNSMYRVKTAVRQALEQGINELLESSTQLDLLRQVVSKRDGGFSSFFSRSTSSTNQRRPYVIVVVGLNGVGKSTSLAKLAYYLKTNGCKPLLAACDTFRSGAVEQLAVHAKCLELPLFSKGYSKDPSSVAKMSIEEATKNGNDVVLVDTAGRMQNNVPLMKALGKLAAENQPDMVVFVGEALVGNDGIDQVKMFDKAISYQNKTQKVNSILLTKFDTVSDKVGAALTMTHVTNAPILFVGTGQKYHHLQKLSTAAVIRSLFR